MASERIAPGMLPRVLNSFDMTIVFIALVLFVVNAAALQPARQSAFTFWILGSVVFLIPGALVKACEQGVVILSALWFSAGMAALRLRFTQSYVNFAVVFYGGAVFVIGLAGVLWMVGHGHPATGGWNHASNWGFQSTGSLTLFGLVILALLGIEVPLNMGVEILHVRAIRKYLLWGSIAVTLAHLWSQPWQRWRSMRSVPGPVGASRPSRSPGEN